MKRTTIKISEELDTKLRHEAELRGRTISEVAREALETYFGMNGDPHRLSFTAVGRSGRSDISERIEEILRVEWGRGKP